MSELDTVANENEPAPKKAEKDKPTRPEWSEDHENIHDLPDPDEIRLAAGVGDRETD